MNICNNLLLTKVSFFQNLIYTGYQKNVLMVHLDTSVCIVVDVTGTKHVTKRQENAREGDVQKDFGDHDASSVSS